MATSFPSSDRLLLAALAILAMALPGCGGSGEKLRPVAGKVTFQGQPVTAGSIRFCDSSRGIDMTAAVGTDGTYEVVTARGPGLPEGTYQVALLPPVAELPVGMLKEPPEPPPYPPIPEKYRNPQTSGLTLTVGSGNNTFDVAAQP